MSASLAPECNESKERYDTCFLRWYSDKFLRGSAQTNDCDSLFRTYSACLTRALKDRGIDNMVQEARNEAQETDAEHLVKGRIPPS
ncbi:hypothetical protein BT63DRAFT_452428 [Microthyrium microscopicum]|uniref:Uncharacterized protein n=1 Tax=Microthyrium microscopicum TaxID=703497 RepID=A0A6A6UI22_9PEZI|nr:hypothetical protein BT63DRAFT_452428 [Microthyrium microscopicum]